MSEINKKLNALNQQKKPSSVAAQPLQAAVVKPVPKNHGPKWAVLGVCAALIAGGAGWWLGANSHADSPAPATVAVLSAPVVPEPQHVISGTEHDVVPAPNTAVEVVEARADVEPVVTQALEQQGDKEAKPTTEPLPVIEAKTVPRVVREDRPRIKKAPQPAPKPEVKSSAEQDPNPRQPLKPKQELKSEQGSSQEMARENSTTQAVERDDEAPAEELMIETVELDAGQLANVEYKKAQKALKEGDSRKAIGFLTQTLKYQPEWVKARQKLAALYYGRGDTRKAIATLQDGLVLDGDQPDLRLTMAKLLVNESQQQAALNVLSRMPKQRHSGYLAMRGALAQQLNNNDLAMSSYKLLVTEEPYDGRWWLGLGIALERSKEAEKALDAYKQALLMGRISSQSQQFIQQRLALLEAQEG
ncbi:tetratricopeptide repeat protein [Photobacterium sp. OFAV2-7]|uniref:tetratricopeptide repeat protein n=1 Tax=Photobacterium sp. OFAV2-7 TaxID=2917748 RepID=UPI001EF58AB6|nr:tetratricopeptide repeat protein [Photobacterium sp. OFAV2-7]MCG7584296.1 hypothetical protein [Photobacterium sp. OFAV2-7]